MKRFIILLAVAAAMVCGCCKTPQPGIELGLYSAETPDGVIYAEFVGENSYKLFTNGNPAKVYRYEQSDNTIIMFGVVSFTCKRTEHLNKTIYYAFNSTDPGVIKSRTSFVIDADTGENMDGKVRCEFTKR